MSAPEPVVSPRTRLSLDSLPPLAPPLDLNAEPVPSPKRPKAKDICWQHVTETGSKATRNYRWTCNYCPVTSALPSVERVYGHFLHFPEVRQPQISKYWKEMITQVQKYGEGYGYGPDRHLLYSMMDNSLLCKEYECVKNRAQTRTRPILEQYMGSIASDGWKNCRRQSLLNVLLVTKNGAEYLKSVNTGGQPKTAEFIASFLRNVLNDPALMGKIIQVVMDNAANCKAAGVILKQEFPHIFFSGCAAHGLDLLLKDIKKLHWVDEALSLVPTVVNLIRGHDVMSSNPDMNN